MTCGIYKIVSPSGKMYIGSSSQIEARFRQHKSELRNGRHHCIGLQRAYDKYNGALQFAPLFVCARENLLEYEQRCIDYFNHGATLYNGSLIAGAVEMTPNVRAKLAQGQKGRHPSKETLVKMRAAKLGHKKGPHSPETIEKMRATALRRSPESYAQRGATRRLHNMQRRETENAEV